jgi:hypothetical protein
MIFTADLKVDLFKLLLIFFLPKLRYRAVSWRLPLRGRLRLMLIKDYLGFMAAALML